MLALVVWVACVFSVTLGYPHGGRRTPVNKRSDYSMYDNQFFDVGDTPLDNEVTDCALVRHQYARGYIRLREFLERMEGCGIKGKMKNIAGIEAATKDAADLPSSVTSGQQNSGAKAAPFKPRPIGEVLENENHQRPQVAAYQNQGFNKLMKHQQGVQKSQMFNNFGFVAQESRPLSYLPNPSTETVQSPLARKLITRKNMDIPQAQALQNLNGAKNKKWPIPQRYFSDQTNSMAQPYAAPAVTVGQPLIKSNPFPSAFHQQVKVTSATPAEAFQPANPDLDIDKPAKTAPAQQPSNIISLPNQPKAFQPANPDLNIDKTVHNVVKPVKQVSHVQSGKIRDDINGDEVLDNSMQDEANEATIDKEESDPLPPETSFSYNPNLEQEDSAQVADATADAENSANLPNHPGSALPLNNAPSEVQATPDDISAGPRPKVTSKAPDAKTSPQKAQASIKTAPQQSSPSKDASPTPQNSQAISNVQKTPKPALPKSPSGPLKGDDLNGGSEMSKLDEFLRPASTTSEAEPDQTSDSTKLEAGNGIHEAQPATGSVTPTKKPGSLAINLDVLKNRISSSKDIGFLKRMLTLIKKITHHKDFNKLGGVQKNAIVQAGKAVHNAVAKNDGNFGERSSIQQRPVNWVPGQYTAQGYVANSYDVSGQQTQRSFVQTNPPKWNPGDYTAYSSYPSYQASLQYHPPHWKPGDYTAGTGSVGAQLVQPNQPQATKKFQIERNKYYQSQPQRPVSYRPPYHSLKRLSFGLYNGNTP